MRFNKYVPLLLVALMMSLAANTTAQQDPSDEAVRGSFITSRPPAAVGGGVGVSASAGSTKSTSKNTGRSTGRSSGKSTGKSSSSKGSTGKSSTSGAKVSAAVKTNSSGPIGLGYTLYMRDGMGDAMRIDPSREFRAGDRIRISMEANTDGYLYVFHTENDNAPTLIFPDKRLNDGDNTIDAHVPYEVPSPFEASENLRWFIFDEKPASERLYIVITRTPIPGIPIGADLVQFCDNNPSSCPLRMSPTVWERAKQGSSGGVKVSKSTSYGQKQSQTERESTTRGLGLDQSAPEPSVVRMNVSTNDSVLVTTLDLVHR